MLKYVNPFKNVGLCRVILLDWNFLSLSLTVEVDVKDKYKDKKPLIFWDSRESANKQTSEPMTAAV